MEGKVPFRFVSGGSYRVGGAALYEATPTYCTRDVCAMHAAIPKVQNPNLERKPNIAAPYLEQSTVSCVYA